MAKEKAIYRCSDCGAEAPQWTGWCPACDASGTLEQAWSRATSAGGAGGTTSGGTGGAALPGQVEPPVLLSDAALSLAEPRPTGVDELDRVLGGGLMPGSVTLLGGEPGIGKSTLLLQMAASVARTGRRCAYLSAEESTAQVGARAQRLGAASEGVWLVSETRLPAALDVLDQVRPDVLIVDSVQTVYDPTAGSVPGSLAQVRSCAQLLVDEAKRRQLSVVLVGHVTKEGGLAGPKVLEHAVDTVLSFEGDRHHALRLLRASKHRFGSTEELGLFEMGTEGLAGVADPSTLFLADRRLGIAGSVVAPILDGQRPLMVEVQALVVPTPAPMPRRSAQGLDTSRLGQVLAVLERRAGVPVGRADVHVAVAGGVKVKEPGLDLAVALAVASASSDTPLLTDLVVCGEIGLGGEVRQVHRTDRRLAEAARLGFGLALAPRSSPEPPAGLSLSKVATLTDALASAGLGSPRITAS